VFEAYAPIETGDLCGSKITSGVVAGR